MRITVDISLYPFIENYAQPVRDFIGRIKTYPDLEIVTTATSTQLVGEHDYIFEILAKETAHTFSSTESVFIMKVIGFERDIKRYVKQAT